MANCRFVDELYRLRKSSRESIDNIEKFDDFKRYMHIVRKAEKDLKEILTSVNASGKKTLILLCGSAGDGKSHLLSYLRNEERMLNDYLVFNDATESSEPSKTAIDTLNEELSDFSDDNLEKKGENIILAINLGVLSNFIESPYAENYQMLLKYVENNNILTTAINHNSYIENSYFQHVSFSDYHMYTLSNKGAEPKYIQAILNRIFGRIEENPFFSTYQASCQICPLAQKCPVKHNYEFLMDEQVQEYIAHSLVEVIVKEKEILTTREILNYIYDILVVHRFSYKTLSDVSIIDSAFLKEYLGDISPVLMFDYEDISPVLNHLAKYDPLLERSESADELAIFYYVSPDISSEVKRVFDNTPYAVVLNQQEIIDKLNEDKTLKAQIFNILIRIESIKKGIKTDTIYSQYITDLYYFNQGKIPKLAHLYDLVEKAVTQWCGSDSGNAICLDESRAGFTLFENIKFEPYLDDIPTKNHVTSLEQFVPSIVVKYEDQKTKNIIELDIDYSLYELLYKLKNGYIQTANDRNNYADFISFIEKILKTGSAAEEVFVISETGKKASVKRTKFGYRFKVVK